MMRADVKLGIVLSMVVVLIAGGYYLYRDRQESPVPLSDLSQKKKSPFASPAQSQPRVDRKISQETHSAAPVGKKTQRVTQKPPTRLDTSRVALRESSADSEPVDKNPPPGTLPSTPAAAGRQVRNGQTRSMDSISRQKRDGLAVNRKLAVSNHRRKVPAQKVIPSIAMETHRVQPGDTFSSLARMYYGSERYTRYLISHNPQITNPRALQIGAVIKIPPVPVDQQARKSSGSPAKKRSALHPKPSRRTYQVQPGDSFYRIAQQQLGDSLRWEEIFELNRDRVNGDPRKLKAGQIIVLP